MSRAAQIAVYDNKRFTNEVKTGLRDDSLWEELTGPDLLARTKSALIHMLASIDAQKLRAAQSGTTNEKWLKQLSGLQRLVQARLDGFPETPESHTKETRAWKALSAKLALELEEHDPTALDELHVPYSTLSIRQWLNQREAS